MNYAFQCSFGFADGQTHRLGAFLLDDSARTRLGIASPSAAEIPEGHLDWMGRIMAATEARFGVVHEFSGTEDEDALVEGFCVHGVTPEDADGILQSWRAAFVERLSGEQGVSAIVTRDGREDDPSSWEDPLLSATALIEQIRASLRDDVRDPSAPNEATKTRAHRRCPP